MSIIRSIRGVSAGLNEEDRLTIAGLAKQVQSKHGIGEWKNERNPF